MENQIDELNTQTSNLNTHLLEKDQKINGLTSQLNSIQSSVEGYQNQINQVKNEKSQLEVEIQSLKQQLQQAQQDNSTLQQQSMTLQQQIAPLQQNISNLQEELSYKEKRIQELKEPKAVMPSTLAQQGTTPQSSNIGSKPSFGATNTGADTSPTSGIGASTGRRECPNCSASGFAIKEVEDKSKIISYIPKPIYAKKMLCTKCGYEF